MPVATLVIVPTSRGVSCGVKASRAWLIAGERAVEDALQALRFSAHWLLRFGRGFELRAWASASELWLLAAFSFRSSPTPFSSDAR